MINYLHLILFKHLVQVKDSDMLNKWHACSE